MCTGGRAPTSCGNAGSSPISSNASRRAASAGDSPSSTSPPGNETSPGCRESASARTVKISDGSGASTSGARTAARRSPGAGACAGDGSSAERRTSWREGACSIRSHGRRGRRGSRVRRRCGPAAAAAAAAIDPDEVLRYARALIAAPSENPGGTEDEAADVASGILTDLGAEIRIVRSEEGRPSVVARIGSGERPTARVERAPRHRARPATLDSWSSGPFEGASSTDGSSDAGRAT